MGAVQRSGGSGPSTVVIRPIPAVAWACTGEQRPSLVFVASLVQHRSHKSLSRSSLRGRDADTDGSVAIPRVSDRSAHSVLRDDGSCVMSTARISCQPGGTLTLM
jgi:hypothetical protein